MGQYVNLQVCAGETATARVNAWVSKHCHSKLALQVRHWLAKLKLTAVSVITDCFKPLGLVLWQTLLLNAARATDML